MLTANHFNTPPKGGMPSSFYFLVKIMIKKKLPIYVFGPALMCNVVLQVKDYTFNVNSTPVFLPHLSLEMFEVLYRIVYTTSSSN